MPVNSDSTIEIASNDNSDRIIKIGPSDNFHYTIKIGPNSDSMIEISHSDNCINHTGKEACSV